MGTVTVEAAVRERLVRASDGNPCYFEELLNYLVEQGLDLRTSVAPEQLDWPASLQSLILSRIDQLTENQRTTLNVASLFSNLGILYWYGGDLDEARALYEASLSLR